MRPGSSKVAVIFHEPVLGGATSSVLRILPLLEEMGWEFCFWVDRPSPLFDELAGRGYDVEGDRRLVAWSLPVLRLPPGPVRRLSGTPPYMRRMLAFLRDRSPALVHANSLIALPEALVAKRSGAPVLLHVHEMSRRSVRGRIARRLAWRADELVAVSQASAGALANGGPLPRIVYEGSPVPEQTVPIREAPRPFVVGCLGVISTRKGSDVFVAAAEQVLSRTDRIEFRLAGGLTDLLEADWGRDLIDRARAAGVVYSERVDTLTEFRSWDGFVLPSRTDPFPIAMLEAQASGLPVIGAASDGIVEQVTPECGRLVGARRRRCAGGGDPLAVRAQRRRAGGDGRGGAAPGAGELHPRGAGGGDGPGIPGDDRLRRGISEN